MTTLGSPRTFVKKEQSFDVSVVDVDDMVVVDVDDSMNNQERQEQPLNNKDENSKVGATIINVVDLSLYPGETLEEQIDYFIHSHGIVLFSKSFCPFCLDVKDFLSVRTGVPVYSIEVNGHPDGANIHKYIKAKTNHLTVPAVFIQGNFIGGCDDVKTLAAKDELEELLGDLIIHPRTEGCHQLETAKFVPRDRSEAVHPPFWFPNVVNNIVIRLTSVEVLALSIICIIYRDDLWGKWLSAFMLVDFTLRVLAGSSISPLGMIAVVVAAPFKPDFRPGPPKQFAASVGVIFTLVSTCCYFTDHEVPGAIVMATLSVAAALEAFLGFCLGCEFFQLGIKYGIFPNSVYRIYTSSRQEIIDSWDYLHLDSNAPKPEHVDTDPSSKIALKYKKKTDEWTKDDFHLIRNMKSCYFSIPLSIAGLAVAFKIASEWGNMFRLRHDESTIIVPDVYYQTFAVMSAFLFIPLFVLYALRLFMYPNKCKSEWHCPQRSPSFGAMTISIMLFAFLLYDEIDYDTEEEQTPSKVARTVFWMGALVHTILVIAKFSEWTGKRLEFEHVAPQWIILPVGLAVASLDASIIPMFEVSESNEDYHKEANVLMARFFLSIAFFMWIALFAVTFFKTVTGHNSDPRRRHGIWVWLAGPCVVGLADFGICMNETGDIPHCEAAFSSYYFIGIFFFLSFIWMTFRYISFLGVDKFNKGYWMDCFCIDTLAACAALFYTLNNYNASRTLMLIGLVLAAFANMVAFLHTVELIIKRRVFFTPMQKWGPLSFFKLTHEAFRGAIPRLQKALLSVDLDQPNGQQKLELFAAHYNRFVTLDVEHSRHEDIVIFKTFNDYFHDHANQYCEDHEEDRVKLERIRDETNHLLDITVDLKERKVILARLQSELPRSFAAFLEHIRGEEDDMQPVGRKYIPLELQKQMARECFKLTSAENWEVILPYVINNLPRHPQRINFLRSLCWSMPERAQQIGAIVYRNVDAVMWQRLRIEIPEIIPRGETNWRRYY